MNVFDLDRAMIDEYAAFSRSFTKIRAQDIRDQIDAAYATRKYWPEPILQINPHYKRDKSVSDLVREGVLHPGCNVVFCGLGAADPPGPVRPYREGAEKLRRDDGHGVRQVGLLLPADHRRRPASAAGGSPAGGREPSSSIR